MLVEDDRLAWAQPHALLLVFQGLNQPGLVRDGSIALRIFAFLPLLHGPECLLHHLAVGRGQRHLRGEHLGVLVHQSDLGCRSRSRGKEVCAHHIVEGSRLLNFINLRPEFNLLSFQPQRRLLGGLQVITWLGSSRVNCLTLRGLT